MPWCPYCDEVFPEGPACPRCRSPLVEGGGGVPVEEAAAPVALPRLKVPRRVRRAFGRAGEAAHPPRQVLALAASLVLLGGGFVLGRLSSEPPVRIPAGLPRFEPGEPAEGAVMFLSRIRAGVPGAYDFGIFRFVPRSGEVSSIFRFSSPFGGPAGPEDVGLVALEDSVAVTLAAGSRALVGVAPGAAAFPLLWTEGAQAAWEDSQTLVVLRPEGAVRLAMGGELRWEPVPGAWLRVLQAPDGAVLEDRHHRLHRLGPQGPQPTIAIPEDARLLAAGPGGRVALTLRRGALELWDASGGVVARDFDPSAYGVLGAAFSAGGGQVAVAAEERRSGRPTGRLHLAVFAADGTKRMERALPPVHPARRCTPQPAWDASERWVGLASGGGVVYLKEVGTGPEPRVLPLQAAGCSLVWVPN